ncbi:MAG TPA: glycosyltransferase family 2 protein [Opitutaceae bacterium]|nr:glycosyltransferase family 2 protein [Opitutaceae bacterium]
MPAVPSLSVIVPARNEAPTVAELIARVRATGLVQEIVVVDDGSTDATREILTRLANSGTPPLRIFSHQRSHGKGAAVRTGLAGVTGGIVLIQDADLEYDPADYHALLAPFADSSVQAVYGSRNLRPGNGRSNPAFYWGGRFLSWFANRLYGGRLTDEATGYKVVRTDLLRGLDLRTSGFDFCAELTGKLLRRKVRIVEVPVSYRPRSRAEGKKIRWHDGLDAIWTLLKIRLRRQQL